MPGARPICGGIFRKEADHRVKTVPAHLRWSLRWLRLSSASHRRGERGAEPLNPLEREFRCWPGLEFQKSTIMIIGYR